MSKQKKNNNSKKIVKWVLIIIIGGGLIALALGLLGAYGVKKTIDDNASEKYSKILQCQTSWIDGNGIFHKGAERQGDSRCGCDESQNRSGPNKCLNDVDCQGDRRCNNGGYCEGESGCKKTPSMPDDMKKQAKYSCTQEKNNCMSGICEIQYSGSTSYSCWPKKVCGGFGCYGTTNLGLPIGATCRYDAQCEKSTKHNTDGYCAGNMNGFRNGVCD